MTDTLVANDRIAAEEFAGEVVLIDIEQGIYFSLQGAAVDLWRIFSVPRNPAAVLDLLAGHGADRQALTAAFSNLAELIAIDPVHEVDAAALPGSVMPEAELCAPGLVVGGGAGAPASTTAGRPVVRFEYQLPAALTVLRHLGRVSLRLRSGTAAFAAPCAMPVAVTWHRLFRT